MAKEPKRIDPSAPKGYDIRNNPLWTGQQSMRRQALQVGRGDYRGALFSGPGGLGKSHIAFENLGVAGKTIVEMDTDANHVAAFLHKHRNANKVIVADDADSILNSQPGVNVLKAAADDGVKQRTIVWQRGKVPINSPFNAGLVFCTNVNIADLNSFDVNQRGHVSAFFSRFQLKTNLFLVATDPHMYNLACYIGADERALFTHPLLTHPRSGKQLSRKEQNEVLAYFHENYDCWEHVTPRTLIQLAVFRLRSPDTWKQEAESMLLPNGPNGQPRPRKEVGKWEIKP